MPVVQYDGEIRELALFRTELDAGRANRKAFQAKMAFALDANVMWFYSKASHAEDLSAAGYAARFLGAEQVGSLIRNSIDSLAAKSNGLYIARSHRHESDMAYFKGLSVDYDKMNSDITAVFKGVQNSLKRSSVARGKYADLVVETLKEEFSDSYNLLLDVIGKGPTKRTLLNKSLKSIPVTEGGNTPAGLKKTLDNIAFVLRDGEQRASFSISQDIQALRDLAMHNAARNRDQIVLLTFDQKLVNIIRLMKYLGEPWAIYLHVENCQSLWIWNLHQILGPNDETNNIIDDLVDDFLTKNSIVLSNRFSDESGEAAYEIYNRPILDLLTSRSIIRNLEKNNQHEKIEFIEKIQRLCKRVTHYNSTEFYGSDIITTAFEDFFEELSNLFPVLALSKFQGIDKNDLYVLFEKHGTETSDILSALDNSIKEHARRSFNILGASSLLAPKTLHAVSVFKSRTSGRAGTSNFVHRLPLPVQGEDGLLDDVVALGTNKNDPIKDKYEKLLKMQNLQGASADLAVAFLYASCGYVTEADSICLQSIEHKKWSQRFDKEFYELCLLRSAMLRIHKTSHRKLEEAKEYLDYIMSLDEIPHPTDERQLRADSELLAGEVNLLLLEYFRSGSYEAITNHGVMNRFSELAHKLFEHKSKIEDDSKMPSVLASKLRANSNINIVILLEFLSGGNFQLPITLATEYQTVLRGIYERNIQPIERISYFEEIISSFALLKHTETVGLNENEEVEIAGSLRNKLGWILQKREKLNDFEYSICEHVHLELKALGFS